MVSASLLSGALLSDAEKDDEDEELLEDCTTEGRCWLTTTPLEPELEITWLRLFFSGVVEAFYSEVDCGYNQREAQDGCDDKAFIDFGYSVFAVAR